MTAAEFPQDLNSVDPNAQQVGGTHYQAEYQHWDLVTDCDLGYFEGQITKYIGRHIKKNGLQDVQKAAHFLDKLLDLHARGRYRPHNGLSTPSKVALYAHANKLGGSERLITSLICFWTADDMLLECKERITEVAAAYAAPALKPQTVRLTSEQIRAVDDTANLTSSEGSASS